LLLHYLAESKCSTKQLYIHISKNNKLHVMQHQFHEFFFHLLIFSSRRDSIIVTASVTPFN